MSEASVVVVGGGYAGAAVARALDPSLDVTLVEPKETFVHSVAALRALARPEWAPRIFLDYRHLLRRGRVIRDRATAVDEHGVTTSRHGRLAAEFVVLASGSSYPFPAKMDSDDSATALDRLAATRGRLATAERVLLVGAGPVGIELAGEIHDVRPDKQITVVDLADDILGGQYLPQLREAVRMQLEAAGVRLVLGRPLIAPPTVPPGQLGDVEAHTADGAALTADIWFRCHGVTPATGYLTGRLARVRREDGQLEVDDTLRVTGESRVFAIGDVTALGESKRASHAGKHAAVVAENILALARGEQPTATYRPGPPVVLMPFGETGGASQIPGADGPAVLGAEQTAELKGRDLMLDQFVALFAPAADPSPDELPAGRS